MTYLGVEYGGRYVLEAPPLYTNGNQLTYYSYETALTNWAFAAPSWTEGTATREALPFTGSHGEYVARLKGKKDATATSRTMTWSQMTPTGGVVAGQKYNASLKANIVDNVQGGVQLYLNWYNAAGSLIKLEGLTGAVTTTGVFEFALNGIVAPAAAVRAQFVFQGTSTTSGDTFDIRVDNAMFREVGPRVVFNDDTDTDYVGILNPDSSGLDSPDIREDSADKVEDDGAIHGAFYAGRRPVILQGTIIATNATQRNERVDKLQRASLALRADSTLSWETKGGPVVNLTARRQQPLRITKAYVKDFQLPLVAADPRIYSASTDLYLSWAAPEESNSVKAPGTVAQIAAGGTVVWVNPNNVKVRDNVYTTATFAGLASSQSLQLTGFGFAIPAAATILGVEVEIERKASINAGVKAINTENVQLIKGGAFTGVGKTSGSQGGAAWSTSELVDLYGVSATDLWGAVLLPEHANASNFGVGIQIVGQEAVASIDVVLMRIYYKIGTETHSQTITTDGSVSSAPIVTVYGPTLNPIEISNATTGQTLKIAKTLTSEQYLEVDFAKKSVLLNGVTDEYKNVTFDPSGWWELQPGSNNISLPASSKTVVSYRSAWM